MNYQEYLNEQAEWILESTALPNLRGATGEWNIQNNTVYLTYYFDGQPTDEHLEEASVASTEIIATFPSGFLEENYIRLDSPKQLPESKFWVYRRQE